MYEELLQEHIDGKRAFGESPQPPCRPEEIQKLRARASSELGVDLPEAYCQFLTLANGLDSNGLVIYASETGRIAGRENRRPRSIEGVVDANLGWWDYEPNKAYLFFGDSGTSTYVYHLASRSYQVRDRQSDTLILTVPSFEHLLQEALRANKPPD